MDSGRVAISLGLVTKLLLTLDYEESNAAKSQHDKRGLSLELVRGTTLRWHPNVQPYALNATG